MTRLFTLTVLLVLPLLSAAQINRPARTAPSSSAPPTPTRNVAETTLPKGDGPIAVKQANGIEIKLLRVEGNAADQQVNILWIMNNPKANTDVAANNAYAVDLEGDEYHDLQGGWNQGITLFTDVPKKGGRSLKGVPPKIKTFKLLKFNFWAATTNQWQGVEFRDISIDWK